MNRIYKKLGKRIKELREEKNISQEELAQALGYASRSMISAMELGKRRISTETLDRLSKYFKIRIADLIEDESLEKSEDELYSMLRRDRSLSEGDISRVIEFIKFVKSEKRK